MFNFSFNILSVYVKMSPVRVQIFLVIRPSLEWYKYGSPSVASMQYLFAGPTYAKMRLVRVPCVQALTRMIKARMLNCSLFAAQRMPVFGRADESSPSTLCSGPHLNGKCMEAQL